MPESTSPPLRLAIAGLTHSHVDWVLERRISDDIELVGIAEPNRDLAERYLAQRGLSLDLVYDSVDDMLDRERPTAVAAFGSIYEHLALVQAAAPRGVHVMVEKPLAVNNEHAREMARLARQHGIHLLTNYQTSWFPSTHRCHELLREGRLGPARKILVNDGHKGPRKSGVKPEFLAWLTDPEQNGGGALIDFGCYGANIASWLLRGQKPLSVTAVTQNFQPEDYPNVEDDATLILNYPSTQVVIQASWNWPIARKDMEICGETGRVIAHDAHNLTVQLSDREEPAQSRLEDPSYPFNDPIGFFKAVIEGKTRMEAYDLSSLENNLLVVEILDAARESARSGSRIFLSS